MQSPKQLAQHITEFHFGGNWTSSCLKEHLEDITWQQPTTRLQSFNTIAALTYHINYFINAVLDVLQGKPLTSKDEFSFNHKPIQNQNDWNARFN